MRVCGCWQGLRLTGPERGAECLAGPEHGAEPGAREMPSHLQSCCSLHLQPPASAAVSAMVGRIRLAQILAKATVRLNWM